MSPLRRFSLAVVIATLARSVPALAAPPAPPPAGAAPPSANVVDDATTTRARQWVKIGTEEYAKQHWEVAHDAYLKAWELKQHFAIAANLADVEMRLGRYREAAEHWKFNLANLPPERADRRSDAEKQLLECRAHLSIVRVSVNVAGANVRLDGGTIGQSPLSEELWLEPGKHAFEARLAGYLTTSREFESAEGESREVALVLDLVPPPRAEPVKPPGPVQHPPPQGTGIRQKTIVLVGGSALTLAAVGIGTGYTVASNAASTQVDSLGAQLQKEEVSLGVKPNTVCSLPSDKRPSACGALSEKSRDRDTSRDIAVASFVAGGVLGVATVVAYILWPDEGSETRKHAKVGLSMWTFGDVRGVQVSGGF